MSPLAPILWAVQDVTQIITITGVILLGGIALADLWQLLGEAGRVPWAPRLPWASLSFVIVSVTLIASVGAILAPDEELPTL